MEITEDRISETGDKLIEFINLSNKGKIERKTKQLWGLLNKNKRGKIHIIVMPKQRIKRVELKKHFLKRWKLPRFGPKTL